MLHKVHKDYTHRIRRCDGNKQAWCLIALRDDGAERDAYGSYITAMTLDALLRRAHDELLPSPDSVVQIIYDKDTNEPRVIPTTEHAHQVAIENVREAWVALAMIREAIELLGPVGALKASEHLDGPTFMHEAEALVAGIQRIASHRTVQP